MSHVHGTSPAPAHSAARAPRRDLAVAWPLLGLLAASAWVLTAVQAHGAGPGAGTAGAMGLTLPLFLLLWLTMMAAMMLPSVAPVAVTWAHAIGRRTAGSARAARTAQFAGGYLLIWIVFGLLAYGALAATGRLVGADPGAGRLLGTAAFLLAGLQQLGPLKRVCLRHCRNPMAHLVRYAQFRPWARDLRVGAHHGLYWVGCCWGLTVVLVPLGVMNVAAMAALAAVVFLEKLWRWGPRLGAAVGVGFLVLAALAPFHDWLLPGLQATGSMH